MTLLLSRALALLLAAALVLTWALLPIVLHRASLAPPPPATEPVAPPTDAVALRKSQFIEQMLPAIQANNAALHHQRSQLEALAARHARGKRLRRHELTQLQQWGEAYRLELPDSGPDSEWFAALLQRLDIIPASLALAQSALESGWGQSRFALEGNNFFGQWCFSPGCGMVPAQRPAGAHYEVERFPSRDEAVRRYMLNLNSHPGYAELRAQRAALRAAGEPLSGRQLAEGLSRYAEIGADYVTQIRLVIRANHFEDYPDF